MKGDLVQEKGWNWRKVSGRPARENLMRRLPVGIVAVALLALFGAGPRLTALAAAGNEESPSAIVYVTDTNGGVSEVNIANNSVVATAPFGGTGAATAVTPDGKRFYVTDYLSANVTVFDAATNVPVAQIPVGSGTGNIGVAVTPDGSTVYVTSQMDGIVTVIATATSTVVRTIATGTEPVWVTISPDGSHAYISNQVSGTVSVIATATNQVVANIGGLGCPYGTRLTRYGTQLLVADQCGNSLHVVNTATNTVIKSIPTGLTPKGVAVTPD
jgi:YVTN family beta-propeller protein